MEYRKQQLAQLAYLVQENGKAFEDAIFADLGRAPLETGLTEFGPVVCQSLRAIENLEKWTSPTPVPDEDVEPFHHGWDLKTVKQPRGIALIIGPWYVPSSFPYTS